MIIEKLQTSSRLVLSSVAILIVAASFYFINHPVFGHKPTSEQPRSNQDSDNSAQPATPTAPTAPTQSSTPTTNTGIGCNSNQKAVLTSQYNSQITAENNRHQQQIAFLNSTGGSTASEDAAHNVNLAAINAQYQNNLRSIGC